jgi:hypothetical protein
MQGVLAGLVAGTVYGVAARFFAESSILVAAFAVMTLAFLFVVPVVVGYLTVRTHPSPSWMYRLFMPWIPTLLAIATSALLGWEGSICILMGTPLLLLLSSVGGVIGAYEVVGSRGFGALMVCLPLLVAPLESRVPLPRSPREVHTTIEIDAPAPTVWRQVVTVPPIRLKERKPALFTALGFPAPIAVTLDRPGVGGVRQATFTGGLRFVETVTVWEENERLSFSIAPQTDAIPPGTLDRHVTIGGAYFDVLDGTYSIEPLGVGRCRLHLLSRTRVSTHFNIYAGLWSDTVMRSIQRNILAVIRARAEGSPHG